MLGWFMSDIKIVTSPLRECEPAGTVADVGTMLAYTIQTARRDEQTGRQTDTRRRMHTHTQTHRSTLARVRARARAHTHTHTHTHARAHALTHTHTHTLDLAYNKLFLRHTTLSTPPIMYTIRCL